MIKSYFDANIFLNVILYEDNKSKKCKELLYDLINGKIIGFTSVLTWDEVVYVIEKNLGKEIAIKEGEKFLRMPNLFFIDANKNIIMNAQNLVKKYHIKPRDAIHISSALANGIYEIISLDKEFDKIKEIKRILD